MAKRSQSFHAIGQGNALQQFSEWLPLKVAIQSDEIQSLAKLIHDPMDKGNQSREELSFIHKNHLGPVNGKVRDLIETLDPNRRNSATIVRDNLVVVFVAGVAGMSHNQHRHSKTCVA